MTWPERSPILDTELPSPTTQSPTFATRLIAGLHGQRAYAPKRIRSGAIVPTETVGVEGHRFRGPEAGVLIDLPTVWRNLGAPLLSSKCGSLRKRSDKAARP